MAKAKKKKNTKISIFHNYLHCPRIDCETELEVEVVSEHRIPIGNYWELLSKVGFKHLDHRWLRTAWWHWYKRKWYPRSQPIISDRPEGWKPELDEEFMERTKGWVQGGVHLDHEKVQVSGIYHLYEDPETKVRVTDLNWYCATPILYVQNLNGSKRRDVFTDEFDSTVLNSKCAKKNWYRRRRARYRRL